MDRDALPADSAQQYIRQAGGSDMVAALLGVPSDEVVTWANVGVADSTRAIALVNLAHFGAKRRGPRARCALVTLDELWSFVERHATRGDAARVLGASERALRRYLSGERVLPQNLAEQIRATVSPKSEGVALPAHGEPQVTPDDHLR